MSHRLRSLASYIGEEIALEGLDGITFQGLWLRLENNPSFSQFYKCDFDTKLDIWEHIKLEADFSLYLLPEPRPDLVIYNRYEHMDSELGIVMEAPSNAVPNIYPFYKIHNEETGEMGSCLHYYKRKNITEEIIKLEYEEVEKRYPYNQVVVVASQRMREIALYGNVRPGLNPLTLAQFCILERIGRTRTMGDVTQGKHGMTQLGNPKTLFYHRKKLQHYGLITKQTHLQKSKNGSQTGSLLHLTRFYVERKSKFMLLIELCVEKLRAAPHYQLPTLQLQECLGLPSAGKLFKNPEFLKYIEFSRVPYTEVFPDAPKNVSHCKNGKERLLKCARLKDPNLQLTDLLCEKDEEEVEEDEEFEDCAADPTQGYLDQSDLVQHKSLLQQAYDYVKARGPEGITQKNLGKLMGQSRLDARTICRSLVKSGIVTSALSDIGRQRVSHFVANELIPQSNLFNDIHSEKHQLLELMGGGGRRSAVAGEGSEAGVAEGAPDVEATTVANVDDSTEGQEEADMVDDDRNSRDLPLDGHRREVGVTVSEGGSDSVGIHSTPLKVIKQEVIKQYNEEESLLSDDLSVMIQQETTPTTMLGKPPVLTIELDETANIIPLEMTTLCGDAVFGTRETNVELLNSELRQNDVTNDSICNVVPMSEENDGTEAMGDNDSDCFLTVDEVNETRVESIVELEKNPSYVNLFDLTENVTSRQIRRSKAIIEMVNEQKVICDMFKIQKKILELEQDEDHKVDKKSIVRLLDNILIPNGVIKKLIVKLSTPAGTKELVLIVHSSITANDPLVAAAVERLKMKEAPRPPKQESKKVVEQPPCCGAVLDGSHAACLHFDAQCELGKMMSPCKAEVKVPPQTEEEVKESKLGIEMSLGKLPGPKFLRLQELHMFLFYETRDYRGKPELNQTKAWQSIKEQYPSLEFTDSKVPKLYLPELSWRMFLPPIRHRVPQQTGWTLVCDVLPYIPLNLFVRIIRCTITSELAEMLKHPFKKFYPVKLLSPSVCATLFDSRKYVHHVMDLINRLCYMGLVQLGQQGSKERDHRFIYVNKHTKLTDTTSSEPGYYQISDDREYPSIPHEFTDNEAVHYYWYKLMCICLDTPLGGRGQQGQSITIQLLNHKTQMIEALQTVSFEEAPSRDVGDVPGDGRGAAGLDSALFSHLRRNWSYRSSNQQHVFLRRLTDTSNSKQSSGEGSALYHSYLMSTTQQPLPGNRLQGMKKLAIYKSRKGDVKSVETSVSVMSKEEKAKHKPVKSSPDKSYNKSCSSLRNTSKSISERCIKPRVKKPKKPYYDDEDKAALRKMIKLRVDWSSSEDSFLLLCKVASCYLLPPSPRPRMLNFTRVRSILHKRFPESRDKTSKACQRRMNYIMKDQTTADSVAIYVEEVKQDKYIAKHFKPPGVPQNKDNVESVYANLFVELVEYLVKKFGSGSNRSSLNLPNSYEDFKADYEICSTASVKHKFSFDTRRPQTKGDIQFHVIQTLIYSSLCCKADKESYALQLAPAYDHYPQQLLFNSLSSLRESQMISLKKCYSRSSNAQSCLPLSASPFQLSMSYKYKFVTRHQYDIYQSCWSLLKSLKQSYYRNYINGQHPEELVKNADTSIALMRGRHEGGFTAALIEQTAIKRAVMHTVLPESIIVIDTNRSITKELPYQKNTLYRRVSDLAEASGRNVDMSAVPVYPSSAARQDSECPPTKKMKLCETEEDNNEEASSKQAEGDSADGVGSLGGDADSLIAHGEEDSVTNNIDYDLECDGNSVSKMNVDSNIDCEKSNPKKRPLEDCDAIQTSITKEELDERIKCYHENYKDGADITFKKFKASLNEFVAPNTCDARAAYESEPHSSSRDVQNSCEVKANTKKTTTTGKQTTTWPLTPSSASRLAVFMKNQNAISVLDNEDLSYGGPSLLQHMQDNLLLTACDVTCQLTVPASYSLPPPPASAKDDALTEAQMDKYLLPFVPEHANTILHKHERGQVETKITLDDVLKKFHELGYSEQIISLVEQIHSFIDSKGIVGASVEDIKKWREESGEGECMAVVHEMEAEGIILREGITQNTWITLRHSEPWLVHTRRLSRVERQGLKFQGIYQIDSTGFAGAVITSPASNAAASVEESKESNAVDKSLEEGLGKTSETTKAQNNSSPSMSGEEKSHLRSRSFLKSARHDKLQDEVKQMEKKTLSQLNSGDHQHMAVSMRPWVRIHGSINRRVLDRMLGTMLFLVLENPGMTGTNIARHWAPALQPVHAFDLLYMLSDVGCVKRTSRKALLMKPAVLFVQPSCEGTSIGSAEADETEDDTLYTPTVDCISRLAVFIADKKYKQDFLSDDRK